MSQASTKVRLSSMLLMRVDEWAKTTGQSRNDLIIKWVRDGLAREQAESDELARRVNDS